MLPYHTNVSRWKLATESFEEMEKRVNVVGAIGLTDRMNRDAFRVLRGGIAYTLTAHIEKDHPLVIKKWTKSKSKE